ncbi:nitrate- and nitrite sensing domain-containing protein [Streptomyces sp. HMX112]|uniref:sensor histidine kinase n=1 Tax=Streptomyces sp. HMX112 TaxID=3390850 RepID=UPI003A81209B
MRLRTMLMWLAVVPTVAMGAQVLVTAHGLLDRSEHLRNDVAAGERFGIPLYRLMAALQAERTATAARWAGSAAPGGELAARRAATDRALAEFHRSVAAGPTGPVKDEHHLQQVRAGLDDLDAHRERADARGGGADRTTAYYTGVISDMIHVYQQAFSHTGDSELTQESRPVVAMYSASEMLARQDTILALAGPSRELTSARFAEFVNTVGAHRYLYDTSVAPYLPDDERERYERIAASAAWRARTRIEHAIMTDHKDTESGVGLPRQVAGWQAAHRQVAEELGALASDRSRGVLARADDKAGELEAEVARLIAASGGALLVVVAVAVFTTRSVLRRLDRLHERTVTVAEKTLPDVVTRLQNGQDVDADALPAVTGDRDEVGRISDAFARAVAVSVDGHRQLAAERQGFGMFAAGIASRTGNLVSRQLSLTEDLQDTFGHDEALLAQLMRADQLTVGMRRQIENLLILAGGEIPDPHTEPMRVADLLREAAAEVEDFRRIERQALDEISVEPRVISQISHLLAELLDNATRFSPPRSKVVIRAELVADGLSVEIEDRGPRVSPASYQEMNLRLHSAPPYAVLARNAHRLGLFVVGHLADQLRATVTLRRSVYGGTSAVVIIPEELLVPTTDHEPAGVPAPRTAPGAPGGPGAAPSPAPAEPGPGAAGERRPELVLHVRADHADPVDPAADGAPPEPLPEPPVAHSPQGLPERPRPLPSRRPHQPPRPADPPPVRAPAPDGDGRPPLPERVPQTHIAEQLREPRAAQAPAGQDAATPEEVADAWADYEDGTRKVEAELRQDQP